jgi:hemoglobin
MPMIDSLHSLLGEETLTRMVGAFYRRVREDDLLAPLYPPDDWENAEKRLRDFLIYRFGGPDTYIQERGHPRLRGRHMPFSIGIPERDRWLALMGQSMREVGISDEIAPEMGTFFAQVADAMRNRAE